MKTIQISPEGELVLLEALLTFAFSCEREMKRSSSADMITHLSKARREAVQMLADLHAVPVPLTIDVQAVVRENLSDLFQWCSCGLPYHGTACANPVGKFNRDGTLKECKL
jgi:hypothetical protein